MLRHGRMRLQVSPRVVLTLLMLVLGAGGLVGGGAEATLASSTPAACDITNNEPAWSADGSKLAFTRHYWYCPRGWELWVMNSDGSNQRRLLPNVGQGRNPTWSPDGSRIAFGRSGKDGWHVYVVNADGTGLRRLRRGGEPAWSPHGDKIAFEISASDLVSCQLYLMNPDGTGLQRLTSANGWCDYAPAWSPDGSKLAFDREVYRGDSSIYVMNADGSDVRKLTSAYEGNPSWSPDGSRIAYRDGWPPGLYVIDADGSNKRQILDSVEPGEGVVWAPSWSREGRIGFTDDSPQGSSDIFSVNPDGSDVRNLTQTYGRLTGDLEAISFRTAPMLARAGKRLTATLTLADKKGVPFAPNLPACRASAGKRSLRVIDRGFVKNRVRCVWSVPQSAQGKFLRGKISVGSCGSKVDWNFKRRVRASR